MERTIFLCDDSLEGICTGVYEAWDSRLGHANVGLQLKSSLEQQLFCTYREVGTDQEKAVKVLRTIRKSFGEEAYAQICQAVYHRSEKKADAVYRTIVLGLHLKNPKQIMNYLSQDCVATVFELSRAAGREAHHLREFLRFRELENGVLLAKIHPEHQVLTMLAPHFADRLLQESFVIYDEGRKQAAVHPKMGDWFLVEGELAERASMPHEAENEELFQDLFYHFCQKISIKERENWKLQRQMLPLKYRSEMPEFQKGRVKVPDA